MCGTAITQGCMLGHAKDEFFDEKKPQFWHWHRGQFYSVWLRMFFSDFDF